MSNPTLYLASNSPRRRQLLALTGWEFSVFPGDVDETAFDGETPESYVLRLAQAKAEAVSRRLAELRRPAGVILASDTSVVDGSAILGKPATEDEAEQMLRTLRNRVHQVYTALAAVDMRTGHFSTDLCITDVRMRNYSDAEIKAYVASGDPMDKAGAYAIQHPGFHPVESVSGCYTGVMGLPICHVVRLLAPFEFLSDSDIVRSCCVSNAHECQGMEDQISPSRIL